MIGNSMQDNWYMGSRPIKIDTLKEFKERVVDELDGSFKLKSIGGRGITTLMGSIGELIIEYAEN